MRKKRRTNLGAQRQTTPTQENKRQFQLTAASQSFSGPIPHPDILEHYEKIVPRAAERILAMAEEDAKHRQLLENVAINIASKERRRGQYFGLVIALAGLITSIVALYFGSEVVAAVIGGTTVVGLVTVFVTGRVIREKNDGGTRSAG